MDEWINGEGRAHAEICSDDDDGAVYQGRVSVVFLSFFDFLSTGGFFFFWKAGVRSSFFHLFLFLSFFFPFFLSSPFSINLCSYHPTLLSQLFTPFPPCIKQRKGRGAKELEGKKDQAL